MPEYVLGSLWFNQTAISLPGNRKFTVRANNQSPENAYIQAAKPNVASLFTRTFIRHEEIAAGGELTLEWDQNQTPGWGNGEKDAPSSLGMEKAAVSDGQNHFSGK